MISKERAERLFVKMQEEMLCTLDSNEIDTLCQVMSSSVVLKAFGRALALCQVLRHEMSQINMAEAGAVLEFSKAQGRIQGVNEMIAGILELITEEDEEELNEDDES